MTRVIDVREYLLPRSTIAADPTGDDGYAASWLHGFARLDGIQDYLTGG